MSCVILIRFCRLIERKKRGGRQSCLTLFPGIDEAFLQIVDPHTAGDPDQDGVLWTNLSRPKIAEELLRRGFRVSVTVVSQLRNAIAWEVARLAKRCRWDATFIAIGSFRSSPTTAPLSCKLPTPS